MCAVGSGESSRCERLGRLYGLISVGSPTRVSPCGIVVRIRERRKGEQRELGKENGRVWEGCLAGLMSKRVGGRYDRCE